MTYEVRKIENEQYKCPRCGGRTTKAGKAHHNGRIRRVCKECMRTYYVDEVKPC
jgi:formylmethanofuran dehydrogenase subunit E